MNYSSGFKTSDRRVAATMLIVSVLLVILNIIRISNISITCDETGSYASAISPYWDTISLKWVTSNNHLLNSLLSRFFMLWLGKNIFWLRFSNLLAQIMFLLFSALLCLRLFPGNIWRLAIFLALNLQPFMFEFWGLSRGYGLALAFMMTSVYLLVCYIQAKKLRQLVLSLSCGALATYSNFSWLDYYCALLFFVVLNALIPFGGKPGKNQILKEWGVAAATSALLCLLVAGPVKKLIDAHELYYGGDKNIFHDTMRSLLLSNLEMQDRAWLIIPVIFIVLCTVATGVYWGLQLIRKETGYQQIIGLFLWTLLVVPAACIVIQHKLIGTLYPIDRTALYFIPLFLLSTSYWLYVFTRQKRALSTALSLVFMCPSIYNFSINMNVTSTHMWWYDVNDLPVLHTIMDETKGQRKNKIAVYWMFKPAMDFYINTKYSDRFIAPVAEIRSKSILQDTTFNYLLLPSDYRDSVSHIYIQDMAINGGTWYLYRKAKVAQGAN